MKGINKNCDPSICMVVGCESKALYRSSTRKGVRGFCARHKAMAYLSDRTWVDEVGDGIYSTENRWRAECSDKA